MKFKFLLLDIDDTVLDFKAAEKFAFKKTHDDYGISFCEEDYLIYTELNKSLWKQFEKGEITLSTIKQTRYQKYFFSRGITADAASFQNDYEQNLSLSGVVFDDGVLDTLEYVCKRAEIYAVTNGMAHIQKSRLKLSGIDKFLSGSFVSEHIGVRKPDKGFFDYVEAHIPNFIKEQAIVVGDSLSADIPAGLYGYKTCLINRSANKVTEFAVKPDFEITKFSEIKNFF